MNSQDTTVFTQPVQNDPQQNQTRINDVNATQPVDAKSPLADKKSKSGEMAVKIGAGVVGGAALGAGMMYGTEALASRFGSQSEEVQEAAAETPAAATTEAQPLHFASGVNDEMSYADAFAAARAEVGAGGVFVWRGGVYGTYNQDEWNAMSPEDRAAFTDHAMEQYSHTPAPAQAEPQVVHEVHEVHVHHHTTEQAQEVVAPTRAATITDDPADTPVVATSSSSATAGDDDGGIRVLGTRTEVIDGNEVAIADVEYDGHTGMLIDVDQDGTIDAYAVDFNDNGRFDDDEIIIINDPTTGGNNETAMVSTETDSYYDGSDVQVIESDTYGSQDDGYISSDDYLADNSDDYSDFGSDDIYVADSLSTDGMDDFVNDANVDLMA